MGEVDAGSDPEPTSALAGQMNVFNAASHQASQAQEGALRQAIALAQAESEDPGARASASNRQGGLIEGHGDHEKTVSTASQLTRRQTAPLGAHPNLKQSPHPSRMWQEDPYPMRWVAGELLVVFEKGSFSKPELTAEMNALLRRSQAEDVTAIARSCSAKRFCLIDLFDQHGKKLDEEQTRLLESMVQKHLAYPMTGVSCNFIKYAMGIPNDPFYIYQWHHEFARMPAAWDISTGSSDIIVAVVDTGLVISHPDIESRVSQGVDMISDASIAGDGNGRDTDPTDPGDGAYGNGQSSWHGSHTAGIIGAETNNAEGVSGITWSGQIQPIRVLGMGSAGTDFDILSGIYWAAGDPEIEDVPVNQNPARVINLSLGGPASQEGYNNWVELLQILISTEAEAYGYPIIIAAAGNQDQIVDTITPANIDFVITVGATRYDGRRASYSNWGSYVDVMAPGGQTDKDQNVDGYPDGILSLFDNDYNFEQGTSMAAPVVSGIAALLLAVDPSLQQAQIEDLLRQTANANGMCDEGCGAGHVDASEVLLLAGGVVADTPQVAVDRTRLIYQPDNDTLSVRLYNIGTGTLFYDLELAGAQYELFDIDEDSGSVSSGDYSTIEVELDRSGFTSGFANLWIRGTGEADGQEVLVDLIFVDEQVAPVVEVSFVQVGAYKKVSETSYQVVGDYAYARSADDFQWTISGLELGEYYVFAVGDDNNDGVYDVLTESFGAWPTTDSPEPIAIEEAGKTYVNVNFGLSGGFVLDQGGASGTECSQDSDCNFTTDAICIQDWQGGYCSRLCDDGYCGAGASCELLDCDGAPCNICLVTCVTDSQCRTDEGYVCDSYGTCTPSGF